MEFEQHGTFLIRGHLEVLNLLMTCIFTLVTQCYDMKVAKVKFT